MNGRKMRQQLEAQLGEREREIAMLTGRVDSLSGDVDKLMTTVGEYRSKEFAIANALMRAQGAAQATLDEADRERESIIEDAERVRGRALEEEKRIIADADRRAGEIILAAKENARTLTDQAEAFMEEYRRNAERLNENLRQVAQGAAAEAERFKEYAMSVSLDHEVELTAEYRNLSALLEDRDETSLPETYDSPAELMQSIYAIEQRDIPSRDGAEELADAGEDAAMEPTAMEPEESVTAEVLEFAADDDLDDHLWTVDEILGAKDDVAPEDLGVDEELNAIIDDVLRKP